LIGDNTIKSVYINYLRENTCWSSSANDRRITHMHNYTLISQCYYTQYYFIPKRQQKIILHRCNT